MSDIDIRSTAIDVESQEKTQTTIEHDESAED
jgi:hypothetical protein